MEKSFDKLLEMLLGLDSFCPILFLSNYPLLWGQQVSTYFFPFHLFLVRMVLDLPSSVAREMSSDLTIPG
jgi:hypothetical protein